LARSGLHSYDQLGASIKAMEARLGEQTRTQLSIANPSLNADGDVLTLELTNTGQTRLAVFDRLDVILRYFDSPTTQLSLWLPYNDGAPTADTWSIVTIVNDAYEPGILNPGESAQIEIDLSQPVEPSTTNLIVIGSETGSTISASFSS
jgi:hypothetical protein